MMLQIMSRITSIIQLNFLLSLILATIQSPFKYVFYNSFQKPFNTMTEKTNILIIL